MADDLLEMIRMGSVWEFPASPLAKWHRPMSARAELRDERQQRTVISARGSCR
jgi:hypothetical protein